MLYLALLNQLIDRVGDILDRNIRVNAVLVKQINCPDFQSFERNLDHYEVKEHIASELRAGGSHRGKSQLRCSRCSMMELGRSLKSSCKVTPLPTPRHNWSRR